MSITPEQQAAFQNEILQEWAFEVERVLKDQLRDKVGFVPSDTLKALRFKVLEAAANDPSAQYFLTFNDSGRISEMKEIQFSKRPFAAGNNFILEWVKKYQQKFSGGEVPGYTATSRIGISREKQLSRIASAIIASKAGQIKRRDRKGGRRRWYNKTFYAQIDVLIRNLVQEQAIRLQEGTKKKLEEVFNQE